MDHNFHHRSLRQHRCLDTGPCYAITACTHRRETLLVGRAGELVAETLCWLRAAGRIRLLAFIVMPDHAHALLQPQLGFRLDHVMRSWKGFSGRAIRDLIGAEGPVWQAGYFERSVRTERELVDTAVYLHQNPCRAGLVERAEMFGLSSAHPIWSGQVDRLA